MKLAEAKVFVVGTPPPGWGGRYFLLGRVTTECGIEGWGEVYAAAVGPGAMTAVIADVFDRHMRGENPENVELMFRRAYSSGFTQRPDPTVIGAFSGLEIACWDILGQARGRPVWALLGGRMNARVRAYTYLYPLPHHTTPGFWTDPEAQAESALHYVNLGFTAIKLDPAGPYTLRGGHQPSLWDIDLSVRMLKAIRGAIGNRADILFGTHGQFTPSGAIRLGRAIEPYDPAWYEEPIPPDNLLDFAQVVQAVRIPLATGERMTTKAEFGTLLRTGGVHILQPALGRSGGIWETKKIAAMAEAFGAQVAPHLYAGPVEWAANIHLAVSCPNAFMVECIEEGGHFHLPLIGHRIRVEDFLHLQMQEAPPSYARPAGFAGGAPRD
jgi:L-alanine-DL-glutamate epimerase-like enolase superfamily enzyme